MVDSWMAASRLKLNSKKSIVIWVGSKHMAMRYAWPAIKIGTSSIDATDNARLLGIFISADLSFDQHVTKIAG